SRGASSVKDLIQPSPPIDGQLQVTQVQAVAETWSPQHVLSWAFQTFGKNVAVSSAFGAEGMVLIDMASRISKDFRLFTIDTEFLFAETYNLMDRIEEKYGIAIERVYSTLSPEDQQRVHGEALWANNPDLCCNLRKVEPLRRKLGELSAGCTSSSRFQHRHRCQRRRQKAAIKIGFYPASQNALEIPPQSRAGSSLGKKTLCRRRTDSSAFDSSTRNDNVRSDAPWQR